MFRHKHVLRSAAGGAGDASGSTQTTQTQSTASTVDVQAEVSKALAAERAAFQKQLKDATGHDSLDALKESQLREQGKLQELADVKTKEAQTYKQRYEQSQINAALLSASIEAVDPAVVRDLLSARAVCDEDGNVTIDGKPAGDAVKELLEDKPFLAKAQGGTGSGSPPRAELGKKQLPRDSFERLDAAARHKFIKDGGVVV